MARYAGVTWRPSPNYRAGPTRKQRVVLHRMAGAFPGGLAWLTDPASQVSANFAVDPDSGAGYQLVDTADVAWAQAAYNPDSLSIEIGGQPGDPISPAAWATITYLVGQAHVIDGVPLQLAAGPGFYGLAYHGQLGLAGGGHFDCPGPVVIGGMAGVLAALRPPPEVTDVPTMFDSKPPPGQRCVAFVEPSGAVFCFNEDGSPGGHYLGGLNNHPEWQAGQGRPLGPAVAITPHDDGLRAWSGYIVWALDPAGRFHPYTFPSDGRYAAG